jgi:metal-dependent amidase/aminoacylase/carboxypeptidase family protein
MNGAMRGKRAQSMLSAATRLATCAAAVATMTGVGACRRADEGARPTTMNPATRSVMSNTAGPAGTPGNSDAAERANQAGSAPSATASPAPVTSTPGVTGGTSGAAGAGD